MSLNTIHLLYGMPMYLVCMFFCALVLKCPSVLVAFYYNQMVCSDGRMPKRWELHWTDGTGQLLFHPVEGIFPTMMSQNPVLYLKVHSGSDPWNFLWPPLLHSCGGCLVVPVLFEFFIHPVLLFSGLLTLHFPVCVFSETFMLFVVLASFICTLMWVPHPCNSWWVRLLLHFCIFPP